MTPFPSVPSRDQCHSFHSICPFLLQFAQYRLSHREVTKRKSKRKKVEEEEICARQSEHSKLTYNSIIIHPPIGFFPLLFNYDYLRVPQHKVNSLFSLIFYTCIYYMTKIFPTLLVKIMNILNMRKKMSLTQGHIGNTQKRQCCTLGLQVSNSMFCPYTTIY